MLSYWARISFPNEFNFALVASAPIPLDYLLLGSDVFFNKVQNVL